MTSDNLNYVLKNRRAWDKWAQGFAEGGRESWSHKEPTWGIFDIPESQAHLLPRSLKGLDTIELGCGAGYVSAWLARLGARPVGLDNSREQLKTAETLQKEYSLGFPLVFGNAEETPFHDSAFDLAISEHGASVWCDPYVWVPEASRILRPNGRLVFLQGSMLLLLCLNEDDSIPAGLELKRDLFGMHRLNFDDANGPVEFHISHGSWVALLRKNGFEIESLVELRPLEGPENERWKFVTRDWARRWPAEEAWVARKKN